MAALSAGLLLYRRRSAIDVDVEVLLGHMGGPYWARRDDGAWSIPKGLVDADDTDALAAACREFTEELGQPVPPGDPIELGVFEQNRSKTIRIWAIEGDLDAAGCSSNLFELEWPPRSGRFEWHPEIDRADWFDLETAQNKAIVGQRQVFDRLAAVLGTAP